MDKTKKFNFREAYERIDAIKARLEEMAAGLENDKQREDFTDAEKGERKQLYRELDILEMKIRANTATIEVGREADKSEANRKMREMINHGERFEVIINRETFGGNTSGYLLDNTTNPAPVTMQDIVEPLYGNLILSAVGAPLLTGLKGNHVWPVIETFSATIEQEGVALGDTKIPLSMLKAHPERIGVSVPITREAINETDDLLQTVATQYIPTAVAALMNKIMFSKTAVGKATKLLGPFVNMLAANKVEYTTEAPSYKELLSLKSKVLASGIVTEQLCYVMTENTKSLLESTPKWTGSNNAILEDGKINGVPVFTTSYMAEGDVYFGSFKYAPQGLFGDMSFIVDPYTLATKGAINFVLNADYAITVLRKEAFAMLSKKA